MALNVSVQSSQYQQGYGLTVTFVDSLTNNTSQLLILERAVGSGFFCTDPEMLTRIFRDTCTAINALAVIPTPVQDAG